MSLSELVVEEMRKVTLKLNGADRVVKTSLDDVERVDRWGSIFRDCAGQKGVEHKSETNDQPTGQQSCTCQRIALLHQILKTCFIFSMFAPLPSIRSVSGSGNSPALILYNLPLFLLFLLGGLPFLLNQPPAHCSRHC